MNERSIKFTALVVEDDPGALHRNGDAGSALPVAAQDHTVLRIWEMNPGFQGLPVGAMQLRKGPGPCIYHGFLGQPQSYLAMVDPN